MLAGLNVELAYFSGYSRLAERITGGAGIILRFEHVRPSRSGPFQPLRSAEITPQFLDRILTGLRRWKLDFVSIDEVAQRSIEPRTARRFVCLTFDGAHRDLMTFAYPVLARHKAPFAVYVPTGFPDGLGEAWWLALEVVIARHERISLVMDDKEHRFSVVHAAEKQQLYELLSRWMRSLAPSDLSAAIADLCKRYGVDLQTVSSRGSMTWDDLHTLAADPLVTIATATVNYPLLANLKSPPALREMKMGRAVAEAALGRELPHFAYPVGDRASFGQREIVLAAEAGFATAVSNMPGVVDTNGRSNLMALPRISVDGQRHSLRALRVLLSGVTFRASRQRPSKSSHQRLG